MPAFLHAAARERLLNFWHGGAAERPPILLTGYGPPIAPQVADEYWLDPVNMVQTIVSRQRNNVYYGEAMPNYYVDYGANATVLFLGGRGEWDSTETIWVEPSHTSIADVERVAIDESGAWRRRMEKALSLALDASKGVALVAPWCLGAAADTTAALIGTENLLYALYDSPGDVKRAFARINDLWIAEYIRLTAKIKSAGGEMSAWHGIWCPTHTTAIQEDFSYMISCEMFDEFCLPYVSDIVDVVDYSFYHLDGIQALKHLKSILALSKLRVVQWQPGAGHEEALQWVDVIREIRAAGKGCQMYVRPEEVEPLVKEVGPDGLLLITSCAAEDAEMWADRWKLI